MRASPAHDASILRREGGPTVEIWELLAREHIRDTLARYNWAGDAARLNDLADTFCVDGVLEIRGSEPLRGRSEIVAFLGGVTGHIAVSAGVKPIVRHNVANVLFNEVTRDEAQVSSYFTVVTHIGLDHFGRYRDTLVPDAIPCGLKHATSASGGRASPVCSPAGSRETTCKCRLFSGTPSGPTGVSGGSGIGRSPPTGWLRIRGWGGRPTEFT